jgi:hypothetical protein
MATDNTHQSETISKDQETGITVVENLVFNPANDRIDRMVKVDAAYVLYDANDSAPTYIGINADVSAATSEATWLIYYFVYDGTNVTAIKRKVGVWDDRVALFA